MKDSEIKNRQEQIKAQIKKLVAKISDLTYEIKKTDPKKRVSGFKVVTEPRSGQTRHANKMARVSLTATRKKIYKLELEMKTL